MAYNGGSTNNPTPATPVTSGSQQGQPAELSTFHPTDGFYVMIACVTGVMVANTRVGPIAFGILTVALIYQTNLLLQGK